MGNPSVTGGERVRIDQWMIAAEDESDESKGAKCGALRCPGIVATAGLGRAETCDAIYQALKEKERVRIKVEMGLERGALLGETANFHSNHTAK